MKILRTPDERFANLPDYPFAPRFAEIVAERKFQQLIPGARHQPHTIIKDAGHFLQEDKGEELAQITVDFIYGKN